MCVCIVRRGFRAPWHAGVSIPYYYIYVCSHVATMCPPRTLSYDPAVYWLLLYRCLLRRSTCLIMWPSPQKHTTRCVSSSSFLAYIYVCVLILFLYICVRTQLSATRRDLTAAREALLKAERELLDMRGELEQVYSYTCSVRVLLYIQRPHAGMYVLVVEAQAESRHALGHFFFVWRPYIHACCAGAGRVDEQVERQYSARL